MILRRKKRKTTKRKTTKRKTTRKKKTKKKAKRKGKAFGGYKIKPDANLAAVLGTKKAVTPAEMTKKLWKYIKRKKLAGK